MRPGVLNPRQILNHLPAQDDWYSIANKSSSEKVDVYLYDEIGSWGITAADFMSELVDIKAAEIVVHISSQGGNVFDGIAIYNALRTHPARVVTTVDSLAASIAAVVVQAGDRRLMVTGSQMMIHEAHGLGMGDADDMRSYADLLDKLTDTIAGIYAERVGGTKTHFLSLMKTETWMTPIEAVEEGLVDQVVSPEPAQNKAGWFNWAEIIASSSKVDWNDRFMDSLEIR